MDYTPLILAAVLVIAMITVFFLVVVLGYFAFFTPQALRRRALKRRARYDYENARGTAHLQMLRQARNHWSREKRKHETQITTLQKQVASLLSKRKRELQERLEWHIVQDRLVEIPGIGPKLRDRIMRSVFRSRLTDLKSAYRVQGIGEARQWDINRWVQHYQSRLPQLLEQDFPGKAEIVARYEVQLADLNRRIEGHELQLVTVENHLARAGLEIGKLERTSVKDFEKALRGEPAGQGLDAFIIGSFAEWEPMPEWFRELISQEID